jgi:hypothetical protein
MKALFTLKSAISHGSLIAFVALASIVPMVQPHLVLAAELQTSREPALVFEIKDFQNQNSISLQQITVNDPLTAKVKEYLEKRGSPLAVYAPEIIKQPQWQRALGISFVESNLGKYCYDNNCSGIGVKPGHPSWRKYETKLDWFVDLNVLLEKPIYKEKYTTFAKMKGVYVQPGSQSWVYGAQKVYDELMEITKQAELERRQIADMLFNSHAPLVLADAE